MSYIQDVNQHGRRSLAQATGRGSEQKEKAMSDVLFVQSKGWIG
jgi:hypothetical protein